MAKMKLKTLSGAKKRFKMTASGKIKRNRKYLIAAGSRRLCYDSSFLLSFFRKGRLRPGCSQRYILLFQCHRRQHRQDHGNSRTWKVYAQNSEQL